MDEILKQLGASNLESALQNFLHNIEPTSTECSLILELIQQNAPVLEDVLHAPLISCPVTKVPIAAACHLTQCRFHAKSVHSANCLLVHCAQQADDKIDLQNQWRLLDIPLRTLKRNYINAVLKIQAITFREWAEAKSLPLFHFYPTTKVCCVCESFIEDQPHHIQYGMAWCSIDCMAELSPLQAYLEKTFGLSFKQLKEWIPKCFYTIVRDKKTNKVIRIDYSIAERILKPLIKVL